MRPCARNGSLRAEQFDSLIGGDHEGHATNSSSHEGYPRMVQIVRELDDAHFGGWFQAAAAELPCALHGRAKGGGRR